MHRQVRQEFALIHDESLPHDPPSAIGPFRVLHQLGAGALGPVYRAFDPDRDRLVAIKVFRLDLTPEQTAELAGALKALARRCQPHPSLAMPITAGIEGANAYLVQQYVPFDTLDMHLRRGGTGNADEALGLLRQVAAALTSPAREGIHHGALHPRDILVSTTGDVLVTGVGVAEALESVGARAPVRRPYAAPERVTGSAWDHRADVFSVAVLAFEMLTGRQPVGTGAVAAAQFEFEDAAIDLGHWQRTLTRGLAENPQERFDSVEQFIDALAGTVDDESWAPAGPVAAPETDVQEPGAVEPQEPPSEPALEWEPEAAEAPGTPPAADTLDATPLRPEEDGDADRSLIDMMDEVASPEAEPAPEPAVPEPVPPPAAWTPAPPAHTVAEPPVVEPSPPPKYEPKARWPDELSASPPARRTWAGPALGMLAGLVAGLLVGYAIWGRSLPGPAEPATSSVQPAPPPAPAAEAPVPQQLDPPEVIPEAPAGTAAPPREVSAPPAPRRPPPASVGRGEVARGRLVVRSSPPGARVSLNGQPRGTTPFEARNLALGAYEVEVARPGHAPVTRRVVLSQRSPTASFSVTLVAGGIPEGSEPVRRAAGAIDIVSKPAGARAIVDGAFIGLTPLRLPELAPGIHTIRLELEGHRAWTTTVSVTAGQTERVAASLEQDVPR